METVDPLWRPLTGASRKKKREEGRLGSVPLRTIHPFALVVGRWTHLGLRSLRSEEAILRLRLGLDTGR